MLYSYMQVLRFRAPAYVMRSVNRTGHRNPIPTMVHVAADGILHTVIPKDVKSLQSGEIHDQHRSE